MMETSTHVFNEHLKRIEPTSTQCSYCYDGKVNDINNCYFVPIFKENDRTNIVVYRSVKFSKILIGIPRCNDCKSIHNAAQGKAILIAVIAALAIIAFAIYNFMNFHPIVTVIFFFGGIFTGVFGSMYLQNHFSRKKGIHSLKEGAESDPLVQDFMMQGWKLEQPTA